MPDILHDFPIFAPISKVFAAVSTPAGLDQWWTLTSSGGPRPNDTFELGFGPDYDWRARESLRIGSLLRARDHTREPGLGRHARLVRPRADGRRLHARTFRPRRLPERVATLSNVEFMGPRRRTTQTDHCENRKTDARDRLAYLLHC
jgi:hypothetical protein